MKRFDESFQKTGESLWKTVFMHKSQHGFMSVIYERYVFHTRVQGEGETIDSFTTDLRLKSQSCEFGSLQHSLIRDRVVVGIRDSKIKERLLRDSELTFRAGNRHLQCKRKKNEPKKKTSPCSGTSNKKRPDT